MTRLNRLRGEVVSAQTGGHERPRDEWIEIAVPAIVSEQTFALAQERLALNKERSSRRTKTPSVVQGIVSCEKCGYSYYRTSTNSSARKIRYYRCLGSDGWRYADGPLCDARPVREDLLDEVIWSEVVRLLEDPKLIAAELDRRLEAARTGDPNQRREKDLHDRLTRVRKSIKRLVDAYQDDLITTEELRERMPELRRQERALDHQLQSVVEQVKDRETYMQLAQTLEQFLNRLHSAADTLDIADRQRIVRLIVKEVLIREDKITIRHSIPIPTSLGGGNSTPTVSGKKNTERGNYLLCTGRPDRYCVQILDWRSFDFSFGLAVI